MILNPSGDPMLRQIYPLLYDALLKLENKMRASALFFRTSKECSSQAEVVSHRLLEQGGFLRRVAKGSYIYTPLMWRVLKKIMNIIREELDQAGCQELSLPSLHPAHLWEQSGRWEAYCAEKLLYTLRDREDHLLCLAPTHEEVIVSLISDWVHSYRELPLNLYQIGMKFRDEIRPRFGLMRAKEFLMKDGYSFSRNEQQMEQQYAIMRTTYAHIFDRLGLDYVIVEAHGGKIGSGQSEEFQVKAEIGEDEILLCGAHAINVEKAMVIVPHYPYDQEPKERTWVETPSIPAEQIASQLNIPPQTLLNVVIYRLVFTQEERLIAIGIRADREINAIKIASHFDAVEAFPATEEELQKRGLPPEISPFDSPIPFYADLSTQPMCNFACRAARGEGCCIHVNWDRDLPRPHYADFLTAKAGDFSPLHPDQPYTSHRGIEVGHIFNVGTKYTSRLNALFQDEEGATHPIWMGTYGIGVGRCAAACVEQHHDERGIIWPQAIAPFSITIIPSLLKDSISMGEAERLYQLLAPHNPLLDDREERLGFKLRESDLIGIPYKLIVGKTLFESGKYEIESRRGEKEFVSPDAILAWADKHLSRC